MSTPFSALRSARRGILGLAGTRFFRFPLKLTRGDRLMLAAQVNGHPVDALLDSAAEASFLDREFAAYQ